MKTFFISTSIPYVNADPHIGFLLEALEADVLSRWQRKLGNQVYFLTGTDDNSLKNVQSAEKLDIPVAELVKNNTEKFLNLLRTFNIQNDDFIKTSVDERHRLGAQKLWSSCKKSDMYKKKYKGLYCVGCEAFKTDKDLLGGYCEFHPDKKPQEIEEENYFFKLSNYQDKILNLIKSGKLKIIPESKRNEILQFVRNGLEDFSISRSVTRSKDWGIKVPEDSSIGEQVMYVWFDALSNYINALGYAEASDNFKKFWTNGDKKIHIVGKDINRFHTIYWPAMLLSAGLKLPDTVFVHGFINDSSGEKMSKSRGNVLDPFEFFKKYGCDPVRFIFLKDISHSSDTNFSLEYFEEKYNSDLANGLGNFASRVSTLIEKNGAINFDNKNIDKSVVEKIKLTKTSIDENLAEFKINEAAGAIFALISFGDEYVNNNKPWSKDLSLDQREKILSNLAVLLYEISDMLEIFIPSTAAIIKKSLTVDKKSIKAKKIENLFPRRTL